MLGSPGFGPRFPPPRERSHRASFAGRSTPATLYTRPDSLAIVTVHLVGHGVSGAAHGSTNCGFR